MSNLHAVIAAVHQSFFMEQILIFDGKFYLLTFQLQQDPEILRGMVVDLFARSTGVLIISHDMMQCQVALKLEWRCN